MAALYIWIFSSFFFTSIQSDLATAYLNDTSVTDVRLADGDDTGSGRVELLLDGVWTTVYESYFLKADAQVICRMLGFANSGIATVFPSGFYGRGTGPQVVSYLGCQGTERNISECNSVKPNSSPSHGSDASLSCTATKVRLMDGDTNSSGRVEIFIKGHWSSICDSGFDKKDATVICSMLGYGDTGIVMDFSDSEYGTGSGTTVLTYLGCTGSESDIKQCSGNWGDSSCSHRQDAGVICGASNIRLVDGPTPQSGRVELLHGGSWGTICSTTHEFDRLNAMVICRMLGYNYTHAYGVADAFYGEGHGPVITYGLSCDGSESDIANCPHSSVWHTSSSTSSHCPHSKDVGVNCAGETRIRLSDGDSEQSGRVELYRNGHWGTLGSYNFDNHDLEVICRMKGYEYSSKSFFFANSYYGSGVGEVVADNLACDGFETDIGLCHSVRWWPQASGADHKSDVGVNCDGNIPMRLVDGPTNGTGRLEIYHGGYYGTVCDRKFDRLDLIVVCRMLGYTNIPRSAYYHTGAYFGQGLGEIVVSDLECNGAEENIGKCSADWPAYSSCDHGDDISVSCDGGFESVRLVNGTNMYSGTVEISHNGQWRTICSSEFDRADAVVICRMLGFDHPEKARAFTKSEFSKGTGTVFMQDLHCNGLESNLDQCKPTYSTSRCYYHDVAGVDCCPTCDGAPNFVG